MNKVATLDTRHRAELFAETADRRSLPSDFIEKDFWVCWSLGRLFALPKQPASMIFKGGTSLSKVYDAIGRFSEDVDLSLNRADLGFVDDRSPEAAPSGKQAQKLLDELTATCERVICEELLPVIEQSFTEILGTSKETWSLSVDDADQQTVLFKYPRVVRSAGGERTYVQPVVRLELGARSDHWPVEEHEVTPYAAEEFPDLFEAPKASVRTLAAERTFWEKATILHALHHRPIDKPLRPRLSRHYYDLAQLCELPIGDKAMARFDLLDSVVAHKRIYFASGWANYETAKPGTLRLVPPAERLREIDNDYAAMRDMMFGEPPSLDAIVDVLRAAEDRING